MGATPQGTKVAGYTAGEDGIVRISNPPNNSAQARRVQKSFKTTRRHNFRVASFRRRSFRVRRPTFRIADPDAAVGRPKSSPFGKPKMGWGFRSAGMRGVAHVRPPFG